MSESSQKLFWIAALGIAVTNPVVGMPLVTLGVFTKWGAKPTGRAIAATVKGSFMLAKKVLTNPMLEPKPPAPPTLEELVEAEKRKLERKIRIIQSMPLNDAEKQKAIQEENDNFVRTVRRML